MNIEIGGLGGLIQFALVLYLALWLSGGTVIDRKDVRYVSHGTDVLGRPDGYPRDHRGR